MGTGVRRHPCLAIITGINHNKKKAIDTSLLYSRESFIFNI